MRVEPAVRRNEVLSFIAAGLEDFSVSRSRSRARGWGIPVPDDPDQVIYVWWDALGNYITALDYAHRGEDYQLWWVRSDRRVHLLGKGVLRFHAVYWPAMLLSAGEPLPTEILVHDYLTVDGRRLSKSAGAVVDPVALVERFGTDAVRWWLLRDVPRVGDADFTVDKLTARANRDLANDLGNLVHRVVSMLHRYRDGQPPATNSAPAVDADRLEAACREAPDLVETALGAFDFRGATAAAWTIVQEANRYVEHIRPWHQAKAEDGGDSRASTNLDATLSILVRACRHPRRPTCAIPAGHRGPNRRAMHTLGRTATHPAAPLPQDLDTWTRQLRNPLYMPLGRWCGCPCRGRRRPSAEVR